VIVVWFTRADLFNTHTPAPSSGGVPKDWIAETVATGLHADREEHGLPVGDCTAAVGTRRAGERNRCTEEQEQRTPAQTLL